MTENSKYTHRIYTENGKSVDVQRFLQSMEGLSSEPLPSLFEFQRSVCEYRYPSRRSPGIVTRNATLPIDFRPTARISA